MVIQKVINNNVISAYDENQQEVVIMGKGIGFKAHTGDAIDESRVEKVFRIENEKLSRQFQEILENIPLEHMQLTSDIITYAKKNLNVQLNQSIYITLTDHINFAIQRQAQGIQLKNALLWETKKFYHQEYLMGKYAIDLLNEKLGTKFSEDEAGFIALHIHSGLSDEAVSETLKATQLIDESMQIIEEHLEKEMQKEALNYIRLMSHLYYMVVRTKTGEAVNIDLNEFVQEKYPEAMKIAALICDNMAEKLERQIMQEEVGFLAIHIQRMIAA